MKTQHPGYESSPADCSHPRAWRLHLLLLCVALLSGCRAQTPSHEPVVEFTKIPPAAQGGRERVDEVAGRVSGARPGQQIVVYARSGPWWVQPWPDKPFIPIKPDGTWSSPTHLGFEYAALLVDPEFHPPPTIDSAPMRGGSVVAVEMVKGTGAVQIAPTKPLKFSGYDWDIRTIAGDRGGLNNLYDADNAWTDNTGALHLRMKKTRRPLGLCGGGTVAKPRIWNLHYDRPRRHPSGTRSSLEPQYL